MHIVVNGGLTEGRQGHRKKELTKAMRYIVAGSALTLCVIMTGCGCGQEKDRSCFGTGTEDQYHTGTITNTGTGYGRCDSSYFEWRYQYGESVSGKKIHQR